MNVSLHQNQWEMLKSDISGSNLSHAYLFSGNSEIGKFDLAKRFASHIADFKDIKSIYSDPDITILDDDGNTIKIDEIRDLAFKMSLSAQSKHKIVIIRNIERLTIESSNAFLKTLEEPHSKVVFILTTSDENHILETIKSRVRVIHFYNPTQQQMTSFIQEFDCDENAKTKSLFLSANKPERFAKLVSDQDYFTLSCDIEQNLKNFFAAPNLVPIFKFIDTISEEKKNAILFLEIWEIILASNICDISCKAFLKDILAAKNNINSNINIRLVLENLILRWKKNKFTLNY